MTEFDMNQQVGEQICTTGRLNGRHFQVGEIVALLDGQVVAVKPNLADALHALRTIDPDPKRGMILEVGPLITDVVR